VAVSRFALHASDSVQWRILNAPNLGVGDTSE
jgi:hypothetical protein